MLVLSRKETERIRLGESIVVTVIRVSGDKVRLGIEAPPEVLVLREELEPHPTAQAAVSPVATPAAITAPPVTPAPVCPAPVTAPRAEVA